MLAACYRNSLEAVHELGLESIGLPSISTGIYGYPLREAAPVAIQAVRDWISAQTETPIERIVFAMFGGEEFAVFKQALAAHAVE